MPNYRELIKFVVGVNLMVLLGKVSATTQVWLWKKIDDTLN